MLDFADMVVLNKFEKRGAEDALRDVRKQWRRNHPDRVRSCRTTRCRCSRPSPAASTIPGVNRLFAALCRRLDEQSGERRAALDGRRPSGPPSWCARHALMPASRSALSGRDRHATAARAQEDAAAPRRGGAAAPTGLLRVAARAATIPRCRAARALSAPSARRCAATPRVRGCAPPTTTRSTTSAPKASALLRPGRRVAKAATDAEYVVHGARPRGPRRQLHRDAEPQPGAEDRGAAVPRLGRPARVPAQREPARRLSLHRRRLSVPPRGGRPDPHVRGRGRAGAHQPALPLPGRAARRRRASRRRSTRPRCMARTRTRGRTSTAASATPACRSRRSTT